jgi:hypothetical protein
MNEGLVLIGAGLLVLGGILFVAYADITHTRDTRKEITIECIKAGKEYIGGNCIQGRN